MNNDEMLQGYLDGLDPDNPEPSDNRSHSYRHGFANARGDMRKSPRAAAAKLRELAVTAAVLDGYPSEPQQERQNEY